MSRRWHAEDGSITLAMVMLVLAFLAVVGLVVDGGAKVRAVQTATRVAAEAARAGAQQFDAAGVQTGGTAQLDPARARAAAQAMLDAAGVTGTAAATTTQVRVSAQVTRPTIFLGLLGINQVTGTGSAESGVTIR